jgi:hypothetical protein
MIVMRSHFSGFGRARTIVLFVSAKLRRGGRAFLSHSETSFAQGLEEEANLVRSFVSWTLSDCTFYR